MMMSGPINQSLYYGGIAAAPSTRDMKTKLYSRMCTGRAGQSRTNLTSRNLVHASIESPPIWALLLGHRQDDQLDLGGQVLGD